MKVMKLFANAQYLTLGELPSELQFDLMTEQSILVEVEIKPTFFQ